MQLWQCWIISSTNFNAQFSLFINNVFVTLRYSPLSTRVLCRRLQTAKITDAVWNQFFLLKMGMLMLETRRG